MENEDKYIPPTLTLTRAANGIIATNGEGQSYVFAADGEENNRVDADAVQAMLYHVLEEMGLCYNKHNQFTVRIEVRHGYDYECKTKKCDLCEETK